MHPGHPKHTMTGITMVSKYGIGFRSVLHMQGLHIVSIHLRFGLVVSRSPRLLHPPAAVSRPHPPLLETCRMLKGGYHKVPEFNIVTMVQWLSYNACR